LFRDHEVWRAAVELARGESDSPNPIERTIREVRRRTRPMGTFQSIESCRRLIYVAVRKLSNERRNAIP